MRLLPWHARCTNALLGGSLRYFMLLRYTQTVITKDPV
jgi:hypothetical protein